jgi:acetolactate synthase-1/2/3 large subunit
MTVGDRMAEALREAGVSMVFGIDDPQALYAGLRKHAIRTVIVHDERSGAFMADGYSRASHEVAVCTGLGGPGATNLATGLFEAYCASVPVIAVVSEATSMRADVHAFQSAPHDVMLGALAKAVVRLDRGGEPAAAVRHAINLALSGRPQPVLLLAPDDYLWEEANGDANGRGAVGSIEYPQGRTGASADAVAQACEALSTARRPVILAGGGVNVARASEELQRFAELHDLPIALTVMGKGAIAETHPLALGVTSSYTSGSIGTGAVATQCLSEADVVLVVGSDLDALTTSGGQWPSPDATVIRIECDPMQIVSHQGIHLLADAREALRQLIDGVPSANGSRDADWLAEAKANIAARRLAVEKYDNSGDPAGKVSPGRIVAEIQRHLGEGDAVVTDASYSSAWALDRICQDWAGRFVFAPRGCGVLGWGLPAALGVKLARPDGQVVCITGDGGFHFSIGEMETAVRYGLDVTVVLLNNGSFGFQRHSDIARQGADPGDLCFGSRVDYGQLAGAFGWQPYRVESFEEFAEAYPAALADGGPSFVEVIVGQDEIPPIRKFDGLRE